MASGEFVPMVSLENPEALENLHRDFQHAGSDIVQAFTYNGHREKMRVIGKEELLEYNDKHMNSIWEITHVGQVLSEKGDFHFKHKFAALY